MTVLHDNLGNPIDASNPLPVDVNTADAIQPTDIQSHLQTTIQTHNAVSVAISAWSVESNWHDSDGYITISGTIKNDSSSVNNGVAILWSNDGTNLHGQDVTLASGSGAGYDGTARSFSVPTKARYFKIAIANYDSVAAHTMSAWTYLTA
jgi:hypothetical protein